MRRASYDLQTAISRLAERGAILSYDAIRAEAGGGSYSAIGRALKQWKSDQPAVSSTSQVPETVLNAAQSIATLAWNTAVEAREMAWVQEREQLLQRIAQLEASLAATTGADLPSNF